MTEEIPVGDSTRAASSDCAGGEGGYGADVERDACEFCAESREGSMILSLLRSDLFDEAWRNSFEV